MHNTEDNKKDIKDVYIEDIRRNMKQSIDKNSILKSKMSLCYDYFHGTQAKSGFMDLFDVFDVKSEKGNLVAPLVYMNLNKIKNKVNVLLGDLIDMGFEASATAINKEAKSRKQDYKLKVLTEMSIKPLMDMVAVESGIDMASELEDDDDIAKHIENYKDVSELSIEACLRYTLEYWSYQFMRLQFLLDVVVAGECHARTSIQNGMPKISRENSLNVYYPRNINDNDFLDSTQQIGVVYYADIREIFEKYKLDETQRKELSERMKNNINSTDGEFYVSFGNSKYFEPYEVETSRCLVSSWEWTAIEKMTGVQAVYENGLETFEVLFGDDAKKTIDKSEYADAKEFKVIRKEVNVKKKGTLIADKYLVDYGYVENQPRFYTDYGRSVSSITSYRPYYINGQSTSMVMDIMQPQDFINYIWTKVQLEVTKSKGVTTVVDVSKLPKEWGSGTEAINTMFHYLKNHGVEFINSQQNEGVPQGGNSSRTSDDGLGQTIVGLMSLMSFMDNEMKTISSINDVRQGNIQSANQLNGVTQMAQRNSEKTSKYLFDNFFRFESKLLTKHAQHIKISWQNNPERWSDIIGDYYLKFLEIDDDIADDDHEVIIKNSSLNRDMLQKYLMAGVEHGLPLHEALELDMNSQEDLKGSAINYIGMMRKKEKDKEAQQAQMQQEQLQNNQAIEQYRQQAGQQVQNQITEREREKMQYKGNVDLEKTAMIEDTKKALSQQQ